MTEDDRLAAALARLPLPPPSAARLHYAAGFAAGRRRARAWQLSTAAATAALAVVAVGRRAPGPRVFVDRVVYAHPAPPVLAPVPTDDANSAWRLRASVLADGSLPRPSSGGGAGRQPAIGAWMIEPPGRTD